VTVRRERSLWPREHGAYAQLLAPLVAAFASRGLALAGALLAIAAFAAFAANEPLLVARGFRGVRRRELDGARARRRLAWLSACAVAAACGGFALAPAAIVVAAIVAVPAAALVVLAWRRAERTLRGEIVAAIALPGAAAPVAVADGTAPSASIAVWAAWSLGYACTVIAVHRVIARHRSAASLRDRVVAVGLAAVACGAAAAVAIDRAAVVALPLAVAATALAIRPPSARRLRAIGIALVAASSLSIALAVAVA
jgi:hypothetical protein